MNGFTTRVFLVFGMRQNAYGGFFWKELRIE